MKPLSRKVLLFAAMVICFTGVARAECTHLEYAELKDMSDSELSAKKADFMDQSSYYSEQALAYAKKGYWNKEGEEEKKEFKCLEEVNRIRTILEKRTNTK